MSDSYVRDSEPIINSLKEPCNCYDSQFKATLEMLIPLVIKEIIKNRNVSEEKAFELLYSSFLYSKLEVESTKLWHLSQLTLANLLNEELKTGSITFPEEA